MTSFTTGHMWVHSRSSCACPASGGVCRAHGFPMDAYDFIVLGGGAAGLSLAYRLQHSPLGRCSMLVIDKDSTTPAPRTWCYWSDRPGPFDHLAHRTWHRLRFCAP